jgi:erythritol kinase (D-erythritol 1-phosphate-forming)
MLAMKMNDGVIIGIDAGTSVIKSVAFSITGVQIAVAAIANKYVAVIGGGVEQDMAQTWRDTAATLKQLSEQIPNLASRLMAISVTGQGDGTWLMDSVGEPVAPAWLWLDARAASTAENYIKSDKHAGHYARTGTGVNACQMNVQLAYMATHKPEILSRATTAFHCKDWLAHGPTRY